MRTNTSTPRRIVWATMLAGLSLFLLLLVSACGGDDESKTTPQPQTRTAGALEGMATDIAANVGKVVDVVEGTPDEIVIVFEEIHVSPAGQVEIAIMLNRLYEGYGLQHIGLEGALSEDGSLDSAWLEPSFTAGQPIGAREETIVQLLEDGEISSAEMMALIYGDVNVVGLDDTAEYAIELAEGASSAAYVYLYMIAVAGLTPDEIEEANDLFDQGKDDEAIEFVVGTDEFTKETYERLAEDDPSAVISCEEALELTDEIEARAADVGAEIEPEDQENLEGLRRYYEACSVRSDTMSEGTLALVGQFAGPPVAMQIGAGHTERVKDRLKDAGVSFAVIRPNSYEEGSENGDLSWEAYERKLGTSSVDPPGSLGELLDGRRKPPPVVGELWLQSKAEIFLLTTLVARAAAQGELPPFDDALRDVLPLLQNVTLLPDTIEVIGNDVVFGVEAQDRNSQLVEIWVRTTRDKDIAEQTLNGRLLEALSNIQEKDRPSDEPEPAESESKVQRVSSDVIAKFAKERSALGTPIGS